MTKIKFKKDLAVGKGAEQSISDAFNGCGLSTVPVDANGPNRAFWDLETRIPQEWGKPDIDFYTEVKYDKYEGGSGNIALEIQNTKSGQPSGLAKTKSHFWCQVLVDSSWIIITEELRRYVTSNSPFRTIQCGGDDNAKLFLYRSYLILPAVFHRIDHLSSSQLREKMKQLWTSLTHQSST